ncbi:MAG: F0F1 ATP synthase subunit A, partial [Acidimicrobiaceae bacterium]
MIALDFPEINSILRWKDIFPGFNKIALIAVLAVVISTLIFLLAVRQDHKEAPRGIRNFAETIVEFIENGVVMQTMGKDGLAWTPFLLTMFMFIYLC